jgi:GTP-binding protein
VKVDAILSAERVNKSRRDDSDNSPAFQGGADDAAHGGAIMVAELLTHGQQVRLLKGGRGGLGNIHFKTSVNRAPRQTTAGKPGQEGVFRLELVSIADIGLVGLPNAGKSSLINCLTNAQSKVAAYPFTTLNPHLGAMQLPEADPRAARGGSEGGVKRGGRRLVIADIPGLIEGASVNRGLGHKFLKHLTRCKLLLFVVDAAGSEGRKPGADYKTLLAELCAYSPSLLEKPRIVVANKIDLLAKPLSKSTFDVNSRQSKKAKAAKGEAAVIEISCATGAGIEKLTKRLEKI